MTQYKALNLKLCNSHLHNLKCGIKNNTEVLLKISSNAIGDSNDENSFPHKLFLPNTKFNFIKFENRLIFWKTFGNIT